MSSPIDPTVANTLKVDLGNEVAASLIIGFAEEIETRVAKLIAANQSGDQETVRTEAHAIRSASSEYGATALAQLSGEIEDGRAVDEAQVARCLEETVASLRGLVR